MGSRSAGKEQLEPDEARAFDRKALELAQAGDKGALAALVALYGGMRASEIVRLVRRVINAEGTVVSVKRGKSKASVRRLGISEPVASLLWAHAKNLGPEERVFPHCRGWVLKAVKRVCRAARVPTVCAHSLRGLHGTLAVEDGATSEAVARQLGHEPRMVKSVTERNYIAPGAKERAAARRVGNFLGSGVPRGQQAR